MISVRTIIEIAGFPKEHVEKTIKDVMETLKKELDFEIINIDIAEAEKNQNMFSTFAEIELKVKSFANLIHLSYFYTPSSIEILQPEEFNNSSKEIEDLFNDLLAEIHKNHMVINNLVAQNRALKDKLGSSS